MMEHTIPERKEEAEGRRKQNRIRLMGTRGMVDTDSYGFGGTACWDMCAPKRSWCSRGGCGRGRRKTYCHPANFDGTGQEPNAHQTTHRCLTPEDIPMELLK